jgi:lipoic acid synthetase
MNKATPTGVDAAKPPRDPSVADASTHADGVAVSAEAPATVAAAASYRASGLPSGRPGAKKRARVFSLTQLPHAEALAILREHADRKIDGKAESDLLFLLEHPPTYTLGRDADGSNLLVPEEECRRQGFDVAWTDRGGDATYHGPGQLMIYPVVDLNRWKRDLGAYVGALEEIVVRALADFGFAARRDERSRGVWLGAKKVASVGVKVKRWVAWHGVALNVNTDLDAFRRLNPCGLTAETMTSLVAEGLPIERQDEIRDRVVHHFGEVFGVKCEREEIHEIDRAQRPPWLKAKLPTGPRYQSLKAMIDGQRLNTVCQSAGCPNIGECWEQGTATFMINGNVCSRSCSFCAVFTGKPLTLDPHEPERVAESVAAMGLEHAVVTAVNRDELADGGATPFARVIEEIRARSPRCAIEVLVPDFQGDEAAIDRVLAARPDVFNHNLETVPRLYKRVRPQARYERSLAVLKRASDGGLLAKSGMMLGLGEEEAEIARVDPRPARRTAC